MSKDMTEDEVKAIAKKLNSHVFDHYKGKGGLKAFCDRHELNYSSVRKVYDYFEIKQKGAIKGIETGMKKDIKKFGGKHV